MSNRPIERGPRVMHGGHKLAHLARDLSMALRRPTVEAAAANILRNTATQAEAAALVRRLQVAELRVNYLTQMLEGYAAQVDALPPELAQVGAVVSQMIQGIEAAMHKAEQDVPK